MFNFKSKNEQALSNKQKHDNAKDLIQGEIKNREYSFSVDNAKEKALDAELSKPRSRAYMELFDAIDMLSATDEEIIAQLKANMNEDTAEEFSNMSAEELLAEIKACFQEEFQNVQIEMKSVLLGVLSKCYIDGCDCHAISAEGDILDHYNKHNPLPEGMEKGRIVFNKYPKCRCVEVYSNCCRVVDEDSTVIKISDSEI